MGIRGRLILLVFGVVFAMFALGLFDLYRAWQFNRQQFNEALKKRSEMAAIAFEQWVNAQHEPLSTLAEIIEDRPIRSVVIGTNLEYLLETRPSWISLQIVDSEGNNLSSLSKEKDAPKSLVDSLLSEVGSAKHWVVSTDRTGNETRPVFTIATPIREGGAVIARIDGEAVKGLFKDIQLGENSVVAVFDKEGRMLYRRSSEQTIVTSEVVGTNLVETLGNNAVAVTETRSPFDGIERVYGLARSETNGHVVVIGISSDRFYQPLREEIFRQLLVGIFIFLFAVGVALLIAYSILNSLRLLKTATFEFATGNKAAKAPENVAGEIGELGKAFNRMAEQINEREARLREIDQLKSEFVSSVSHELRTPLTTIKTLAYVLRNNQLGNVEKTEYLNTISAECDRQIFLVSNILDVSKIEAGTAIYELSETDAREILIEVHQIESSVQDVRNVQFKLNIPEELPAVSANKEALHRVLRLLLENAVKYSPEDEIIEIEARVDGGYVAVSIMDRGCGIATQDLPFIFNKFYRGRPVGDETQSKNQISGVGLGLYIAGKIIEQLDGRIEVENREPRGTILTVYLNIRESVNNGETITDC